MSVWKTVKNDVLGSNVNEKMLEAALADIGIGLDRSVHSIRNSWGSDTCDAALTKNGKVTSMGIKWTVKYQMQMNHWTVEQQTDVNGKVKLVLVQA